ncbi:MAG: hypothetical protein ACPGUZ_04115 [Holosporaceae bacterium]
MRNLILIAATLSMLLFGCGCDEKKEKKEADVEVVTDAGTSSDTEVSPDAATPVDAVVLPGDVTPQG